MVDGCGGVWGGGKWEWVVGREGGEEKKTVEL